MMHALHRYEDIHTSSTSRLALTQDLTLCAPCECDSSLTTQLHIQMPLSYKLTYLNAFLKMYEWFVYHMRPRCKQHLRLVNASQVLDRRHCIEWIFISILVVRALILLVMSTTPESSSSSTCWKNSPQNLKACVECFSYDRSRCGQECSHFQS